jgi:hypothetical protein
MNRCRRLLLQSITLALALGIPAFQAAAQFAPRPFPPKAQRGVMQIIQPPEMVLNGKADRLSPGAHIRDANNMMVMSGALMGQSVIVNFVREPNGMVHEVWILTAEEAALQPGPSPLFNTSP